MAWKTAHAIESVWLESDRTGRQGIETYCGRRARLDPKPFFTSRAGIKWTSDQQVCSTCRRITLG